MTVLMLRKGDKSLQLAMNSFIPKLGKRQSTVDKSAYSRARHKLKHAAFIELNQVAVVQTMYEDGDYQTLLGKRILAVDGSLVMLPKNSETEQAFGTMAYDNKHVSPQAVGTHVYARASTLYDVLNRVALDARLEPCVSYEVDLAAQHLTYLQPDDLVIYDRGYASFRMMALASQAVGDFLIRVPSGRFKVATDMLRGTGPDDVIVELAAPAGFQKDTASQVLPTILTVRFIRVTLDNGEYEVLVTSLLDQQLYPAADFKQLYWLRWGIETFYGILKTRLDLENFSGLSPEAIRQDFFATIYLTGVESIMTEDAEVHLRNQRGGYPKKVNKAVSFSVIKEHAFELFYSKAPDEERLEQLTRLFTSSPTLIRKDRKPPRSTASATQRLGFWRRTRKSVF
jgi:Transposase DDE domain